MDSLDFSEEEILEQLAVLGYRNIPKHRLREFKKDLDELIRHGELKNLTPPVRIGCSGSQPGPPAYTKEKVSHFDDCEGFFLHDREADQDGRVHGRDLGRQHGWRDSYAQHSVAAKLRLPPGAPCRLQVEPDPDDALSSPLADSCASSPDTQGRRFIKRKVLRKHKGRSLVCDESVYSEDSDATSCLEERLAELHLSTAVGHDSESDDTTSRSSDTSETSPSAFEAYIRGMTQAQGDLDLRPKSKSFIRPMMSQQTAKKSDPVAKYFQYKQLWEMFRLPGETDRRAIRQEIKDRLAYQPPPPKPRRVYVPNTYIVPTEKRRSALRWEIRNDLANGLIPYKYSCPF